MDIRTAMNIVETGTPQWAPVLKDHYEIAAYIESVASDYVDREMMEEYYHGAKAVLRAIPASELTPGDADHNIPSKVKERKYAKLPVETMPPLVVQNGQIEDGNHRFRVGLAKGMTEFWCYDVVDA